MRNFACTICLLVGMLFMVLWARSYFTRDVVHWHMGGGTLVAKFVSHHGGLTFTKFPAWSGDFKTLWGVNPRDDSDHFPVIYERHAYDTTLGFAFRRASIPSGKSNVLIVSLPHWFLVLMAALLVAALKTKPRRQFTLLNLFVLVTCVALVLGMFAAADRASGYANRDVIGPNPLPSINGRALP